MNENRNEQYLEEIENEVENYDDTEIQEDKDSGLLKKIVIGGLVGGTAIVLIKKRKQIANWLTKRKIRSLEKKGYLVSIPVDEDDELDGNEVYEAEIVEED